MLVMRSERHKYPPHSMVITSASAIDSSNRCLEGLVCASVWWQADGLACHSEKMVCVEGAGPKPDHNFQWGPLKRFGLQNENIYSKPISCKFVTPYICIIHVCPPETEKEMDLQFNSWHPLVIMLETRGDWQGSLNRYWLQIDSCSTRVIDQTVFHSKWLHFFVSFPDHNWVIQRHIVVRSCGCHNFFLSKNILNVLKFTKKKCHSFIYLIFLFQTTIWRIRQLLSLAPPQVVVSYKTL